MDSIFIKLEENCSKILSNIENINQLNNIENYNTSKILELISNISTKLSYLVEETDELFLSLLDNNNNIKSSDEINRIKSLKINEKIKECLLPIMFILKLNLENNNL